ncbi:hypothetical protein CPB83DRAFT_417181 [Crepidotus variabilis]|uniref:PARP catalytic domain-containing protein n=1 Tax=Crepidotus variabilis TaxID=179855 RepID=A0A9P6JU87_9AGAR|nr:hypothetical protein CPB83DRAFT_417181 [Crepidotus variabilis]
MASALPLALSLLGTFASAYPLTSGGTQKSAPQPYIAPSTQPPASIPGGLPATAPSSQSSGNVNSTSGALTTTGAKGLCDSCQLRPKHFDGTKTHPYCSKTCATKKTNGASNSSGSASSNCIFCHNRPKYFDGSKSHDYCSKACAKTANTHKKGTLNNSIAVCQAPGCTNPPHSGGHEYCSIAHKNLGENLCIMCMQAPKMAHSHFCNQTCADDAESKGPMIIEVPYGHSTFKSVADQFKSSWRHVGSTCPTVKQVYKIVTPKTQLASYNAYKAAVESRGQFVASGRSEGNENRRWHGTRRVCNLGDKGQTQFCNSTTCSLCCIIRTSYDITLWGKKTGWGRFGKGIYTSSTSSKSNDYSHNDCKSNLKAILLNKVVVGKGCKMLQDHTTLTTPPSGFDSVLAEKGGSLNYDELVVYNNDAIRPSFLVMYEA